MSQLTKEYFDKTVKNLATKQDVKGEIDSLAIIVNAGFEDIQKRLDFSDRVYSLETDMKKIKGALRL